MGAPAAAIALRRAERHIVEHLRREDATHPDRAIPLPDLRLIEQRRLRRLLNAQVDLGIGRAGAQVARRDPAVIVPQVGRIDDGAERVERRLANAAAEA